MTDTGTTEKVYVFTTTDTLDGEPVTVTRVGEGEMAEQIAYWTGFAIEFTITEPTDAEVPHV